MKIFSLKSINFGKKIPIKTCKILDKKQGELVDATIYEHDCKDLSDAYEVQKLDKFFAFKELLVSGMHRKFLNQKIGLETQEHYYSLQNSNGEILGCCRTLENKDININLLSSKKGGRYKYIGQNIVSAIGEKVLNQNSGELKVMAPIESSEKFYEDACGFKKEIHEGIFEQYYTYYMPRKDIADFVNRVENKTKIRT